MKWSPVSLDQYTPGTQPWPGCFDWSLGLVLGGWPSKIEVIWAPGIFCNHTEVLKMGPGNTLAVSKSRVLKTNNPTSETDRFPPFQIPAFLHLKSTKNASGAKDLHQKIPFSWKASRIQVPSFFVVYILTFFGECVNLTNKTLFEVINFTFTSWVAILSFIPGSSFCV